MTFILIFIAFLSLYGLATQILPRIPRNSSFVNYTNPDGIDIWISSNGVHTDIVMPAVTSIFNWHQLIQPNTFEDVDSISSNYVAIGWGDKGFYLNTPTWDDLTIPTALKAVTGLGGTAIHVTYLSAVNENERCVRKRISPAAYKLLVESINSSFLYNEKGNVIRIEHPGYGVRDNFYEAVGTYSMFITCNVWTGQMLTHAGIRVGLWTPFESSVMSSIQ